MKAVLCGYYGMGNGGDEALLAALLQMLPPEVTPLVLSGNPAQTQAQYGVQAYPRKSAPAVWGALRQSQVFIWGGGSLMQDATSALNPVYYGGLMGLAQGMGLKTVAWGQGIGPLRRSWSRWLTRRCLQRATGVSVRDRSSAELLQHWQIPGWLAPDPVWALESDPVPGLWDLPAPRVAVALRSHPWLTPDRLTLLGQALQDFQRTSRTHILLVPFQPVADQGIAQTLHQQLPDHSTVLTVTEPRQLKGVFRGVEMVIAMRLHALVMGAAEGCRCLGLSYDPKVEHLLGALSQPGWDLNPQPRGTLAPLPSTARDLSRSWLEHYVNGDPLSPDRISALVDRAYLHQELLKEVLSR